ncbi:MAG: hypothetical protein IKC01_03600, partial [Clostridia bacterium]|nr:hypothetical protein [Clostridia bacterium]
MSYLTAASIISITGENNTVRVDWAKVEGATSYSVYRQTEGSNKWELLGKCASTKLYFEDANVENGKTYKYTVATENEYASSIVGANAKSFTFLLAPTIAAAKNKENGIEISWGTVSGAETYQLYRKNDSTVDWTLLATTEETSYLDENVMNGTTYHYAVKTISEKGTSGYSPEVATVSRILAPEVLALEPVGDGIVVTWNSVQSATGYNIYRKARGEAAWQKIGDTGSAATSYKDVSIEGGYYTYAVTATLSSSESVKGTIFYDAYLLKTPSDVSLKNLANGIEVTWKPSLNATYYIVKRTVNGGQEAVVAEVNGTSYVDTDVEILSTYAYSVTAVDANGLGSLGNEFTLGLKRIVQPAVKSVVCNSKSVTITWELLKNVEAYRLYKRIDNGSWVQIPKEFKSDESSYEDTEVVSGKKYTYAVASVIGGTESALDEDFAKSVTFVNRPTGVKASSTSIGVNISWDASNNSSSFIIYKRVKGRVAWEELAKVENSSQKNVSDSNVESGTTYEYAIKGVVNGAESELSEIATVLYLDKVTITSLADVVGGVRIKWAAVKGAKNYLIYRRTVNGTWETIATVASNVFVYTDKTAESGKSYYYTVRALNGNYRGYYENRQIYYLAAPKVTKFDSQIGKGITVKWADVHGAEEYYVYRKTGNSGWKKIATTDNLLYVDKNVKLGQTYTYTLKATGNGITSKHYPNGWKRQFTSGTPVASSVKISGSSATIKWNAVTKADGYVVYRKVNNASKWTRIAKLKGTSYVDKGIKKNTKYTYTIRSYKGSVYSDYNKTGWSVAILSTPAVKAANASTGIKVSWSKNNAATGYTVYRSQYDTSTRKWSSWKTMGTAKVGKTSWVDKSVVSGRIYRYTVRTVCGSSKSAYKASNTVHYLKQPTASIVNATTGMSVKWSKSTGATGYRIYRSQLSGGKWSSWKLMGTAKPEKTNWIDKSVVSGTTYKYAVRAVKGSALSSYTATKAVKYIQTPQLISVVKTDRGNALTYGMVPGVDGYKIYRKTSDTSWVSIANVDGTQNVEYLDTEIKSDVEYTYTVRAYSGGSFSSYNPNGIVCK